VHNDGDVPLENVSVTDDKAGSATYVTGDDTNGLLDPGETWQFTADYEVLTPQIPDVENEATATAEYYGSEVSDTDTHIVDILHPALEVIKTGPEHDAYFNGSVVPYSYKVTNTGDCDLFDVSLVDDNATPGDTSDDVIITLSGLTDLDADTYADDLAEGAYATGRADFELVCPEDNYTYSLRSNVATATGVDAIGGEATDCDCWTVISFHWQPRTICYRGNWDNHYSSDDFKALFDKVLVDSINLRTYQINGDNALVEYDDVHDFLLGKPPKFKGDPEGKQQFHMEKQFLATQLNVRCYKWWVHDGYPYATPDAGMPPEAIIYLTADCMPDGAVDLFDEETMSVINFINGIEEEKDEWGAEEFGVAYEVLDIMNNAENNHYCAFVHPDFDSEMCLLTGDWELEYWFTGDGFAAGHNMSIVEQDVDGSFSGTGYSTTGPAWTWNVTGTATDSNVSMTIDYNEQVGGEDYSVSLTGTMSDCDIMSGTATDSKANNFDWTATRV